MNHWKKLLVTPLLTAVLGVMIGVGCSESGNVGGFGGGNGTIDLVVGDKAMSTNNAGGQVLIWYNIMSQLTSANLSDVGTDSPAPDVVIGTSEINWPARIVIADGDLFVSNSGENVSGTNIGSVLIYRNYLTLQDNDAADVVLDATGSNVGTAKQIQVFGNDLFLADWGTNGSTSSTTKIWRDVDTLASHDAPDVVLDNATSLNVDSRGLYVASTPSGGSDLYVGNWENNSTTPCTLIFRDQASLTSTVAPDVVLTNNTSFLDLGSVQTSGGCRDVLVNNNILYVAYGYSDHIFIFNNASALADNDLPDMILSGFGTGSKLNTITSMEVFNGALFVTNHNETDSATGTCCFSTYPSTLPGLNVFLNAGDLTSGQAPDATLTLSSGGISYADRVAFAGNVMFVTGGADNDNAFGNGAHSSVFIYSNPTTSGGGTINVIAGDDATDPNFIMDYPTGLAVTSR